MGSKSIDKRVGFAGAVLLILALAACGGTDSDTASAGQGSSTAPLTDNKFMISGVGGSAIGNIIFDYAMTKGYYQKEGLDPELVVSQQGAAASIAGLVSGRVDTAMSGAGSLVASINKTGKIRLFAVSSNGYNTQYTFSNEYLKKKNLALTSESDIAEAFKAMEGARISITAPGDSIHQVTKYLLARFGIPESKVTFVSIGSPAGGVAALRTGRVDVLAASAPYGSQAEQAGIGKIIVNPAASVQELKDIPYFLMSTTQETIDKNPELLTRALRALAAAGCDIKADPSEAKAFYRERLKDLSDEAFETLWTDSLEMVQFNPAVTEREVEALAAYQQSIGVPLKYGYQDLVPTEFIQSALAGTKTC